MDAIDRDPVVSVRVRGRELSPAQWIVLSFAAAIAVGTVVLRLPMSQSGRAAVGWLDALFTATSAICVTGLAVVDTGTAFSGAGQVALLALIQAGGLGILTVGTVLALVAGRRLGFRERLTLQAQLSSLQVGGVVRLVRRIVAFVVGVELLGALLLCVPMTIADGWVAGTWNAIFHAVSAFNNAGFSLYPDNLVRYVADPIVNLVIASLIVLGGLGFIVVVSLVGWRWQGRRAPLSLHNRIALTATALLIGTGTLLVLVLEWSNPRTLGALALPTRVLAALFQSITPRTAGFNTLDYGAMEPVTLLVTMLLMFIGGNPGSTAGGIKTVTFFVLIGTAWSLSRGRGELQVFGRRVRVDTAVRAGVVALISVLLVFAGVACLSITDTRHGVLRLAFEAFSAFGTVGLSTGITPDLSAAGKLMLIALMFVGRLGPLTLGLALMEAPRERHVEYPAEDIVVG